MLIDKVIVGGVEVPLNVHGIGPPCVEEQRTVPLKLEPLCVAWKSNLRVSLCSPFVTGPVQWPVNVSVGPVLLSLPQAVRATTRAMIASRFMRYCKGVVSRGGGTRPPESRECRASRNRPMATRICRRPDHRLRRKPSRAYGRAYRSTRQGFGHDRPLRTMHENGVIHR
jgi:hypothetical protein